MFRERILIYAYVAFTCLVFGCCTSKEKEIKPKDQFDLNSLYPLESIVIKTHTEWARGHYPERIKKFKAKPLENNDIVFLGNSITEGGGNWDARFNNPKVKNRGIAGDTTEGVLARLGELIYFKPAQVFMLIGINDLFRDDMSSQNVHDNIISIVRKIHEESPETKICVQTILPTTTNNLKEKIKLTNRMLGESESKETYELIQLYSHFVTEEDSMNNELSVDGIHLNEKGYNLWVENIKNIIDK